MTVCFNTITESTVAQMLLLLKQWCCQEYGGYHGKILESAELWALIPLAELQEHQEGDDGSSNDKHRHQAGQ